MVEAQTPKSLLRSSSQYFLLASLSMREREEKSCLYLRMESLRSLLFWKRSYISVMILLRSLSFFSKTRRSSTLFLFDAPKRARSALKVLLSVSNWLSFALITNNYSFHHFKVTFILISKHNTIQQYLPIDHFLSASQFPSVSLGLPSLVTSAFEEFPALQEQQVSTIRLYHQKTSLQLWDYNNNSHPRMNPPVCFLCDQPVTRVCVHPGCHETSPFLCEGECKRNSAVVLHTHNGYTRFIPYDLMIQKIKEVAQTGNHGQHLESVKKRAQVIKDTLDSIVKKHEEEMNSLELRVTKETLTLMDQLQDPTFYDRVKGQQIAMFMNGQFLYEEQEEIGRTKDDMKLMLRDMKKAMEFEKFRTEDNKKRAKLHLKKGYELLQQNKYSDSLEELKLSNKYNRNNPNTLWGISICEIKLNNLEQSLVFAQKCIDAGATGKVLGHAYNAIGTVHHSLYMDNKMAIEYFTRAIDTYKYPIYYRNCGKCHFYLNEFQKAVEDYSAAISIDPDDKWCYSFRAESYRQLGKVTEAEADDKKAKELKEKGKKDKQERRGEERVIIADDLT